MKLQFRNLGLFVLFVFILSIKTNSTNAQSVVGTDPGLSLHTLTPASPNAANLGLYGNIPVSYFTGTPNINIPLYEINAGFIKLPISLSYHGGGIKVEEVASWVGLGWNLNAGGVITRTIRGIPDDINDGVMNQSMKVKFIIENGSNPAYTNQIKEKLILAGQEKYDTEPDVYYFNFGSYSGKFVYDQESNVFYTIPRSNLKISFDANKDFFIEDENGIKYEFSTKEISWRSSNYCTGSSSAPSSGVYSSSISSWYLTRIEKSEGSMSDIISFTYSGQQYSMKTIGSSTSYILFSTNGGGGSTLPQMAPNTCFQEPLVDAKKLNSIEFKNGQILFTSTAPRCDLANNQSLDKIEVFNQNGESVKTIKFSYGYFGGTDQPNDCNDVVTSLSRRLKLKAITEGNDNVSLLTPKTHKFFYNGDESITFPSRLSFEQDHWGYFNGKVNNMTLIPDYIDYNQIFWPGADRTVDPLKNQMGSLIKIQYPTGGTTEFEYESNTVHDNSLYPHTINNMKSIEGDHIGNQSYYESSDFVINEPPSVLNNNNPNGGVYANVSFTEIGNCGYNSTCPPATNCAVLNLVGVSSGTSGWGPFTCNMSRRYLPNGTYKLTASFNQPPHQFEDFYFEIDWLSIDPNSINPYAGGIRVKKITDYDGINHTNDIVKSFSYVDEISGISYGNTFGQAPNYASDYEQQHFESANPVIRHFTKLNSYSNYPLLTSSGSYVGYSKVIVKNLGNNSLNGKSIYEFTTGNDIVWGFPFPVMSLDWRRGQLKEEQHFKSLLNSNFQLLSSNSYVYENGHNNPNTNPHKSILGLKIGFNRDCTNPSNSLGGAIIQDQFRVPAAEEYETYTDYIPLIKEEKIIFDQLDENKSITTIQDFEYNFKNYQPLSTIKANSKGETFKTIITYPVDYNYHLSNSGMSAALLNLVTKNVITVPVEKYIIKRNATGQEFVVGGTLIEYKTDKSVPSKIFNLELNTPIPLLSFSSSHFDANGNFIKDGNYKERILFNEYDISNNILEQRKENDILNSYIWGNESPVAECINAPVSEIAYTSFEDEGKGNWAYTGNSIVASDAFTGRKYFNLAYSSLSMIKTVTNANKAFVVSYWSKDGAQTVTNTISLKTGTTINGWTYFEHIVSGNTTYSITWNGGSGRIDEVRFYPKDAQMTTYTYDELIGMTSVCDINNKVTYYEYDLNGRLKLIRDENKNIIKLFDYKNHQ